MNEILQPITRERIGWAADVHLNFVDPTMRPSFYDNILAAKLDALILAGDITVARYKDIGKPRNLVTDLQELANAIQIPIYFSLGNHDYWFSTISSVQEQLLDFLSKNSSVHWLDQNGVVEFGNGTALVGADTWVDDPWERISRKPKDWIYIEDFVGLSSDDRLALSKLLASQAATRLKERMTAAAQNHKVVFVVSHIPPLFPGNTSPQISDYDRIAVWFGSAACGVAIISVAADHPSTHFIILSGHLHARIRQRITTNIELRIAAATYYEPQLEEVLAIGPSQFKVDG